MVWSPLAGGLLSGKFGPGRRGPEGARRASFDFPPVDKDRAWKCIDAMREIGEAHGVSRRARGAGLAAGQALRDQRHHRRQERRAARRQPRRRRALTLSAEEMARLDEVSALPPEYPGWMLARQSAERIPQPK